MPRSFQSGARLLLAAIVPFIMSATAYAQLITQPRELAVLAPPKVAGTYAAGHPIDSPEEPLPPEGIAGLLIHAEDMGAESGEACDLITNAETLAGNIAFVRRGECDFCLKVLVVAEYTEALAVVIYNDKRVPDDDASVINYSFFNCSEKDLIPSLFVSRSTGLLLLDALATGDVTVRLQPALPTAAEDAPELAGLALTAYPNPASGAATLTLTLPAAGRARVEVFDVLGRRVGLVHDGALGAGPHALEWATAGLPAGLYVVRATAGGATVTQRLVVR